MTEQVDKILKSIEELLSKTDEAIWVRLDRVVDEKIILGTNFVYHLYTIKQNVQGTYMVDELADYIIERIVDYVIPKKERDKARKLDVLGNTTSNLTRLVMQASSLFNSLTKTGEAGELLLYVLAVDILRFPLILNKMYLKTSPKFHCHGADGLHVSYDIESETMSLYWCEAKMYQKFSAALNNCLDSIQEIVSGTGTFGDKKTTDLNLVIANLDKTITDPNIEKLWIEFFDKDNPKSNRLKHSAICFIGFDAERYSFSEEINDEELKNCISNWEMSLTSELKSRTLLQNHDMHIFLMPMRSVQEFRKIFLRKMGKII